MDYVVNETVLQQVMKKMETVQSYTRTLEQLATRWDLLSLLGQMSGTGTDMSHTRLALSKLSTDLLENLAKESLKKTVHEISAKAQVTVDILIRNLFERTADIGFLATDDEIKKFLSSLDQGAHKEEMLRRFSEYVAKYSVYDNIILTNCEGEVLLQLDEQSRVNKADSVLIHEALTTGKDYVEYLGHCALQPQKEKSLLYAYRVMDQEKAIGILLLSFRFEDEMKRIYHNLLKDDEWLILTILDANHTVITSSDSYQIPVGALLSPPLDQEFGIVKFAGRLYLVVSRMTKGYQGYQGLGWIAQAMIPLEYAFLNHNTSLQIDNELISSATHNKMLFSETLRSIPVQASAIQKELDMTVWNGTVRQRSSGTTVGGSFAKSLLWEVSNTGEQTKEVFESSIKNLQETVISSMVNNAVSVASLGIDIMDRNLYERANDCRWWALTPLFRSYLQKNEMLGDKELQELTTVLRYINSLYTVYTNLILFDKNGKVMSVSNDQASSLVGRVLHDGWVKKTLEHISTQSYAVSEYVTTSLYDDRPTYIYSAPIFGFDDPHQAIGGIGIVFDSQPQFYEMLNDILPSNEASQGSFALFIDDEGRLISSTHPSETQTLVSLILNKGSALKNGETLSLVISFQGVYYALGLAMSKGYREYKSSTSLYHNNVIAAVFIPLGKMNSVTIETKKLSHNTHSQLRLGSGNQLEIGTFFIGDRWFGFETQYLVEAISPKTITTLPGIDPIIVGRVCYQNRTIDVLDIRKEVGVHSCLLGDDAQVIVVKYGEEARSFPIMFGILVDELGTIPEVNDEYIESIEGLLGSMDILGSKIVRPDGHSLTGNDQMLVILEPERIIEKLKKRR